MQNQTINISIPAKLLRAVDEFAKKEARSRSELFREAVRSYVLRQSQWRELFSYAEKQAQKKGIRERDVGTIISEYRAGKK